MRDARVSRLARNQSNGQRPLVEVPRFPSRSAHDERSGLNLVFVERLAQAPRKHRIDLVDEHLASRQAKIVNLSDNIIGVPADAQNQAKAQRLLPLVLRQTLSNLWRIGSRHVTTGTNATTQRGVHWAQAGSQSARGSLKKGSTVLFVHDDGSEKLLWGLVKRNLSQIQQRPTCLLLSPPGLIELAICNQSARSLHRLPGRGCTASSGRAHRIDKSASWEDPCRPPRTPLPPCPLHRRS